MYLYKRENGAWYLASRDESGNTTRRSLGKITKEQAYLIMAKIKAGISENLTDRLLDRIKIVDAFDLFVKRKVQQGRREKFYLWRVKNLTEFFNKAGIVYVDQVKNKVINDLIEYLRNVKHHGNATISDQVIMIKGVFRLLYEDGLIKELPSRIWPTIKMIPKHPESLGYYTFAEIQTLKAWFQERHPTFRDIFIALIYTGCRKGELNFLTAADVSLENSMLTIRSKKTESSVNDMYRYIEIHPDLRPVLAARIAGKKPGEFVFPELQGKNENWILYKLRYACRKSGIPWKRVHGLRHTFISAMLTAGVPLRKVMAMAGHTRAETTLRYSHLSKDDLIGEIKKLGY